MEDLKVEVRERNDLINGLQNQNDVLQAENRLYETRRVDTENLLDLWTRYNEVAHLFAWSAFGNVFKLYWFSNTSVLKITADHKRLLLG